MSRSKRLFSGILSSALSRGVAAMAPIVTVPISLQFLGASGYGAWTAALALTAFAVFADLGVGAGLMTKLSAAMARGDYELARRLTSSAYVAVAGVVTLLLVLLWGSRIFLDWGWIVAGIDTEPGSQTELIALVVLSSFLINVIASLIVRIQYATQQVANSNVWQTLGSALGIGSVFLAAGVAPSQSWFVAAAVFTPPAVAAINTVVFFWKGAGKSFRPALRYFRRTETRLLMGIGSKFLIITVLMSISLSMDSWIIAQTVAVDRVPEFSIPARVFAVIGTLVAVLTMPLWPSNAEALNSGDTAWVRRTAKRMLIVTPLLVGILSGVTVILTPTIFEWWLGGDISASFVLLCGLAAWNVAQAVVAPLFMVQNAAGVLRPQLVGYTILIVSLPIKWFVSSELDFVWLPLVTVTLYCIIIWPAAAIGYRKAIRAAESRSSPSPVVSQGATRATKRLPAG